MATIGVRTPLFESDPGSASRVRFGTADDRNRSASFQLATELQTGSLHYGKLVMTGFWPRARFPAHGNGEECFSSVGAQGMRRCWLFGSVVGVWLLGWGWAGMARSADDGPTPEFVFKNYVPR